MHIIQLRHSLTNVNKALLAFSLSATTDATVTEYLMKEMVLGGEQGESISHLDSMFSIAIFVNVNKFLAAFPYCAGMVFQNMALSFHRMTKLITFSWPHFVHPSSASATVAPRISS